MQRNALCRSRRELSNEYLLAKFGVDTAENELRVSPNRIRVITRNLRVKKYAYGALRSWRWTSPFRRSRLRALKGTRRKGALTIHQLHSCVYMKLHSYILSRQYINEVYGLFMGSPEICCLLEIYLCELLIFKRTEIVIHSHG